MLYGICNQSTSCFIYQPVARYYGILHNNWSSVGLIMHIYFTNDIELGLTRKIAVKIDVSQQEFSDIASDWLVATQPANMKPIPKVLPSKERIECLPIHGQLKHIHFLDAVSSWLCPFNVAVSAQTSYNSFRHLPIYYHSSSGMRTSVNNCIPQFTCVAIPHPCDLTSIAGINLLRK